MTITEEKLSKDIKGGVIAPLYYFYGDEPFLTSAYTDRVLEKTVGDDDMNLIKYSDSINIEKLSDSIESLPLFAEKKAVLIKDMDIDSLNDDEKEMLENMLSDIPDFCTVIISMINRDPAAGKKSPNKDLLQKLTKAKHCTVCNFSKLSGEKIAGLVVKKAAKRGCVISRENALYLAESTLENLTQCSIDTEKLCDYRQSGEITREDIDRLVIKQPDAGVYELANAIAAGKRNEAFMLLDDLLAQRLEPIMLLASLSTAYIDYYRAYIGRNGRKIAEQVVSDFGYAKNRAFVVSKAMRTVASLPDDFVRRCLGVLCDTDIAMKSTGTDNRLLLEKCVAQLFAIREGRL